MDSDLSAGTAFEQLGPGVKIDINTNNNYYNNLPRSTRRSCCMNLEDASLVPYCID